jgi:hypothetical protein
MAILSKIWDKGKKESTVSVSLNGSKDEQVLTLLKMLLWVSMTPLGGPVVPDV